MQNRINYNKIYFRRFGVTMKTICLLIWKGRRIPLYIYIYIYIYIYYINNNNYKIHYISKFNRVAIPRAWIQRHNSQTTQGQWDVIFFFSCFNWVFFSYLVKFSCSWGCQQPEPNMTNRQGRERRGKEWIENQNLLKVNS